MWWVDSSLVASSVPHGSVLRAPHASCHGWDAIVVVRACQGMRVTLFKSLGRRQQCNGCDTSSVVGTKPIVSRVTDVLSWVM